MREFELIRQLQQSLAVQDNTAAGVELGIGDDAAVLAVSAGQSLVAATDTLNEGTHFPIGTPAHYIAHKCLAVNLSDLAAMGATPRWALLSLSLPNADPQWLQSFIAGFKAVAKEHGVVLVGGDTTSGPLSVCVTALGVVARGQQLQRDGANTGDLLVISGTIGGAARVLELLRDGSSGVDRQLLDCPQPRVRLGQCLAGFASACIDVSDGLLADLRHVLRASNCGARIELARLPYADILADLDDVSRWNFQLSGGDDYELLFALPSAHEPMISEWQRQLGIKLSIIGQIEKEPGIRCVTARGDAFEPTGTGYEHFGSAT